MLRITSSSDPLNILLVEDSKGDAILIQRALYDVMPESHTITRAIHLSAAITAIAEAESDFDVILLDRSLPDVVGFTGLNSLQNMAPKSPIIFLTAHKDESIALAAIEQGAQDYLFKDDLDGHRISRAIQFAILRKQFEGVLITRANYDMLTGLANRMLFESRLDMSLAKMKRQGGNIAVFFIDLDGFKQINDRYGHAAGDSLLKLVAKRLKDCIRPYDTAARFGGDEFAILLENMASLYDAEMAAQKITELFKQPFPVSGKSFSIGISIGIRFCTAQEYAKRDVVVQHADQAMYRAKSKVGSSYIISDCDNEPNSQVG